MMNALIETASPMGGELRMQVDGEGGEDMARRLYVTQLLPGMVLSNGTLITRVYRHVRDQDGMVREFLDSGDTSVIPNDGELLSDGPVPAGKVRLVFADGVTRDWGEDTRVKILDTVE